MKTVVQGIISSAKDTDEALDKVLKRIQTDLINSRKDNAANKRKTRKRKAS